MKQRAIRGRSRIPLTLHASYAFAHRDPPAVPMPHKAKSVPCARVVFQGSSDLFSRARPRRFGPRAGTRSRGPFRGCDRVGANQNALAPGAASRCGVASIEQARWNLLRPARARKMARTPCSRPTPGGADAAIGPNRHGPSKETKIYRVEPGAALAALRAGATRSRGPACGDATVEPATSVSPPASRESPRSDPQRGPSSALRHALQRYLP
jgi:hypothetical protein